MVLNCKTDKTPWTNMEDRPSLTEHLRPVLPIMMVSRLVSVYSMQIGMV